MFIVGGDLPIFLNVDTEFLYRRSLPICLRLAVRLTKVFLKNSPIVDGLLLVTPFRYLGLAVEHFLFLRALNFGPFPLVCTQIGKE